MPRKKVHQEYSLVNMENFNAVEAYKMLRTNLEFSLLSSNKNKIIMVTSSITQEGKTHIIVNLSFFLTQIGYRILLIDCDLRKPKIHRFFSLSNKTGVTNIVIKKADFEQTCHIINPNLSVLCAGPTPPNPVEILNSKNMKDLIDNVSSMYDYVMIDSPPSAFLSDPVVLAPLTNGILYVIKHSSTPVDIIKLGIDNLKKANANIIGAIFSQVEMNRFGGYYHYKYMDQYNNDDKAQAIYKKRKHRNSRGVNIW